MTRPSLSRPASPRSFPLALVAAAALIVAGCGNGASPSASPLGARPSLPAQVQIVQPTNGETVTGTTVHVVLKLSGAKIVPSTTNTVKPDEGHVHLYVDNVLVSMNYGLEQDLPVHPGNVVLKAEFVASDHAPFNPRVWSNQVVFTVK
jgi:hypothetical protein